MTRAVYFAVVLALVSPVLALFGRYGYAAPPVKTNPALVPWFRSLSNPATGLSCCAESDGHILGDREWRLVGDHYEIMIAGNWSRVPQRAVLNNVPNPTGGAVAFYLPGYADALIYCFVRPTDT